MSSQSNLNIILEKVIELYNMVYKDELVNIYLYGSCARGDSTDDSDIDVVAIVNGERLELQNKLKDIWDQTAEMELDYDVIISPTVIPKDEFDKYKAVLPFYRNIEMEGVPLNV